MSDLRGRENDPGTTEDVHLDALIGEEPDEAEPDAEPSKAAEPEDADAPAETESTMMARALWSSPGNPTNAVSRALGIPRWRLRRAIHRIKQAWGLGGRDHVTIWDDGSVTDENGAHLGNIFDEG